MNYRKDVTLTLPTGNANEYKLARSFDGKVALHEFTLEQLHRFQQEAREHAHGFYLLETRSSEKVMYLGYSENLGEVLYANMHPLLRKLYDEMLAKRALLFAKADAEAASGDAQSTESNDFNIDLDELEFDGVLAEFDAEFDADHKKQRHHDDSLDLGNLDYSEDDLNQLLDEEDNEELAENEALDLAKTNKFMRNAVWNRAWVFTFAPDAFSEQEIRFFFWSLAKQLDRTGYHFVSVLPTKANFLYSERQTYIQKYLKQFSALLTLFNHRFQEYRPRLAPEDGQHSRLFTRRNQTIYNIGFTRKKLPDGVKRRKDLKSTHNFINCIVVDDKRGIILKGSTFPSFRLDKDIKRTANFDKMEAFVNDLVEAGVIKKMSGGYYSFTKDYYTNQLSSFCKNITQVEGNSRRIIRSTEGAYLLNRLPEVTMVREQDEK